MLSKDPNNDRRMVPTPRYSPLPSSATTLATPTMTLSASPVLLKDDFTFESSTDVAAALAAMSWKQTALERDGRDLTSFLAISSGSSSTSSDEDDDHYYGPVISSPSPSPVVENVSRNLRIRHSRVPSSSHKSPQPKFPAVSRNNGSRFSGSEEEEDEEDEDEEDDDNIPLAKRIPGAITAQKCIRRQVLQERGSEKQEKALRDHSETSRSRLMTLRPGALPSNLHDAAATRAASQTTLQRISRTFLRNGSRSLNPFSREDSARRLPSTHRSKSKEKSLRDVHPTTETLPPLQIPQIRTTTPIDATSLYQHSLHHAKSMTKSLRDVPPPSTTEVLPPVPIPPPSSHTQRPRSVKESPSQPYQYHTSPSPTPINSSYAPSLMAPLRAMRSFHFHRPSIDYRSIVGMDDPRSVPLPSDAEKIISQNSTNVARSRPSTRDGPRQQTSTFPSATPAHHHRSLSRSRSAIEPTLAITIPEPVPPIPLMAMISQGEYRKLFTFFFFSRAGSNRISTEAERQSRSTLRQHRPAQSLSSPAESLAMIGSKPELVVQQRVFIGNMQRFNMVEINESTTAGDIIEMIEAEGSFTDIAGIGGWMVFEIAQDFGMGTYFFFYPSFIVTTVFVSTFFFFSSFPF